MPTLTRLILIMLLLALAFFGIMLGLVLWVKPTISQLTVDVPAETVRLRPWPFSTPQQQEDLVD